MPSTEAASVTVSVARCNTGEVPDGGRRPTASVASGLGVAGGGACRSFCDVVSCMPICGRAVAAIGTAVGQSKRRCGGIPPCVFDLDGCEYQRLGGVADSYGPSLGSRPGMGSCVAVAARGCSAPSDPVASANVTTAKRTTITPLDNSQYSSKVGPTMSSQS